MSRNLNHPLSVTLQVVFNLQAVFFYLDGVFSSVIWFAARVVAGNGGQSVVILCLSVKGRKDVDLSLMRARRGLIRKEV